MISSLPFPLSSSPFLSLSSFPSFSSPFNFWRRAPVCEHKAEMHASVPTRSGGAEETGGTYACHSGGPCMQSGTHKFHCRLCHCCRRHARSCTLQTENGDFFFMTRHRSLSIPEGYCFQIVFTENLYCELGITMGLKS